MKEKDCIKKNIEHKNKSIMIRLTTKQKVWLTEKSLSPTRIFIAAMKELGYKGD